MDKAEARRLTNRAKKNLESWVQDIRRLYSEGGYILLGYANWTEYREAEFPNLPQFALDDRGVIWGELAAAGMSNREIAATTGVDRRTVDRTEFIEPVQDQHVGENTPDVDHDQDQQVIVDLAPPRPPREKPTITPHDMFDPLRQVRDTLRQLGDEYMRAGTPRMSGQALNVVLLGLEESEQALVRVRELVMQSEPIDEELQRMGEQQ